MSRSNPTTHQSHPAQRWFEWNGSTGALYHYDKEAKTKKDAPLPFTFILLDELQTVKGWNDASESGVYANEVRDLRAETLVVKAFKAKHILAEGLYSAIRDRIAACGGHYVANLYVAYKSGPSLAIGSLQFAGSALSAWLEFRKANRVSLYAKAVKIGGFTEGKKGKVIFRVPKFELIETTADSNELAMELDKHLQEYLKGYFSRTRTEQVSNGHVADSDEPDPNAELQHAAEAANEMHEEGNLDPDIF